jgi:hypothetical protein
MDVNTINAYLERAREIIGERTPAEIEYDNAVVTNLANGKDIRSAVRTANQQHPAEALKPAADQWDDVAARYQSLRQHKTVLKRLGIRE